MGNLYNIIPPQLVRPPELPYEVYEARANAGVLPLIAGINAIKEGVGAYAEHKKGISNADALVAALMQDPEFNYQSILPGLHKFAQKDIGEATKLAATMSWKGETNDISRGRVNAYKSWLLSRGERIPELKDWQMAALTDPSLSGNKGAVEFLNTSLKPNGIRISGFEKNGWPMLKYFSTAKPVVEQIDGGSPTSSQVLTKRNSKTGQIAESRDGGKTWHLKQ